MAHNIFFDNNIKDYHYTVWDKKTDRTGNFFSYYIVHPHLNKLQSTKTPPNIIKKLCCIIRRKFKGNERLWWLWLTESPTFDLKLLPQPHHSVNNWNELYLFLQKMKWNCFFTETRNSCEKKLVFLTMNMALS